MATLAVQVSWTYTSDPTKPEDGFIIQRQDITGGGPNASFSEVGRAPAGAAQFIDTTITAGRQYGYKVAAYAGTLLGGVSTYMTASAPITPQVPAPNAPNSVSLQTVMV